jgi:PAS domain S-box-containing protein
MPAPSLPLSESVQTEFLRTLTSPIQFAQLLDLIEGTAFFAKNHRFQIVLANRAFFQRLGFKSESEILGRADFELFPKPLAQKFRADDERILATASPLHDIVELFLHPNGSTDWYITQKIPALDHRGCACGILGVVQRYDPRRSLRPGDPAVARAAQMLRDDPGRPWKLAGLARSVGLSIRHFDRKFKECFGLTPQAYLLKTRIQWASEALREPAAQISEVATRAGFCDQSAFTAQFRRHMGITPLRYLRQFQMNGTPQNAPDRS